MKKVLVWGTGKIAERFVQNGCGGEIIGFIETHRSKETYMQRPVYDSSEIPEGYDYIIVANSYGDEICERCRALSIDPSRLIFLQAVRKRLGCTDVAVLKEILSDADHAIYCSEYGMIEDSFFEEDARSYTRLNKRPSLAIQEQYKWPVITDKYAPAGTIGNYFWQDLWAARRIISSGVKEHFDIGSRVDGFIAHLLAAKIDVTMIDIRSFPGEVEHLHTIVDDATSLCQIPDESIRSMSALCSLEHFGLGRYGDPVDPEACFKCFDNIQKKLEKGGRFYLAVPVGRERVEFNAHRVFYASTVISCFSDLRLEEFSCTAEGKLERDVDVHKYDHDPHDGEWRYGLFLFKK